MPGEADSQGENIQFGIVLYQSDKSTEILPVHKIKLMISENEVRDIHPKHKNDFEHLKYVYAVPGLCGENCQKLESHVHYRPASIQYLSSK